MLISIFKCFCFYRQFRIRAWCMVWSLHWTIFVWIIDMHVFVSLNSFNNTSNLCIWIRIFLANILCNRHQLIWLDFRENDVRGDLDFHDYKLWDCYYVSNIIVLFGKKDGPFVSSLVTEVPCKAWQYLLMDAFLFHVELIPRKY
jgi:hypothetical protein